MSTVLVCAILATASVPGPFGDQPAPLDATVVVDGANVLEPDFLGLGVQWSAYPWWDVSDDDWDKVFRRLRFMRLPFTRVVLDAFWYCRGFDEQDRPVYDWNTSYMQKLYRLLDYCQRHNVVVMLGEWGRPLGKDLDLASDDPRWTHIVGGLLEHLFHERNYTCIRYYNLINEPHGWWSQITWDEWKRAIGNLHAELGRRGLQPRLLIASPDADRNWTTRVLKDPQLRRATGIYDEHWYVYAREIENGLLELYTRDQLRKIRDRDPGKQFVLGELGLMDGKTKDDKQPNVFKFWYGAAMGDAAIQMIRGGMSGFIAWDLDDAMHFCGDGGESMNSLSDVLPDNAYERRKVWGMWNILGAEHGAPNEETLRPWYYPWAMLSRAFPPGCQTLETEDTGVGQLRVAAARVRAGSGYHVSCAVVNSSKWPRRLKVRVPQASGGTILARYDYFDANEDNVVDAWPRVVDERGADVFPGPTEVLKDVDWASGVVVNLPSRGVVILTSLDHGDPVVLGKTD